VFCDPPSSIHPSSIRPGHSLILSSRHAFFMHSFVSFHFGQLCHVSLALQLTLTTCVNLYKKGASVATKTQSWNSRSASLRNIGNPQSTGARWPNQYNLIRYGYNILFMAHILQAPKSPNEINQFWHLRSACFNDHQLGRTPLNLTTPHQSLMKMRGSPMDLWMLPLRST